MIDDFFLDQYIRKPTRGRNILEEDKVRIRTLLRNVNWEERFEGKNLEDKVEIFFIQLLKKSARKYEEQT